MGANSILIPVADTASSRAAIAYVADLLLCPESVRITLLHVHRIPSGSEALMGKRYMASQPERGKVAMEGARSALVAAGFSEASIETATIRGAFSTVAEGIEAYFEKHPHSMVVIGRKRMTKAEEFVLGDISVKLVRSLENTAVLVVKTV